MLLPLALIRVFNLQLKCWDLQPNYNLNCHKSIFSMTNKNIMFEPNLEQINSSKDSLRQR